MASRLMQARGLKLVVQRLDHVWRWSRLMQARGLKHQLANKMTPSRGVAPHAGAWIETAPVSGRGR